MLSFVISENDYNPPHSSLFTMSSLNESDYKKNKFSSFKGRKPGTKSSVESSNKSREDWLKSSTGMNPTDLLMQVIIPEFDGRITTKPSAFKEVISINKTLCSNITSYKVDIGNIKWISKLASNYVRLNNLGNFDKKISLVVANYPVKNGRIGNGVGLNTPKTLLNILYWLLETLILQKT